jgi:alanine dehydrogenase
MSKPSTPFSKAELLPQEEKLEVKKQKGELFIGIPKENSYQEIEYVLHQMLLQL